MEKLKDKIALIVDDDERNTFALKSYLESLDMKTVIAPTGKDAIFIMRKGLQPDIILLDMMMPIMDGFETLNFLKQSPSMKGIPVIAVTARAMKGDREKCIEAGAWDYVSKPIDMNTLVDKIVKLIA